MDKLIKDGVVISKQEFLEMFPNVSFPLQIPYEDYGWFVVAPAPKPTYNETTEDVVEASPVFDVNHWIQQWEVVSLSPEQVATNEAAEAARLKALVPKSVTMRQARLALLENGLLSTVQQAIANMQGVEGDKARIEWEFSSEVVRDKQLVASLGAALSLAEEQLDALFTLAATL